MSPEMFIAEGERCLADPASALAYTARQAFTWLMRRPGARASLAEWHGEWRSMGLEECYLLRGVLLRSGLVLRAPQDALLGTFTGFCGNWGGALEAEARKALALVALPLVICKACGGPGCKSCEYLGCAGLKKALETP